MNNNEPAAMRGAQELFILMFLLRGLPFVDLAYLRKSDLRGNVISYRRRKTGRPLSVTLTSEAMFLLRKYMSREEQSPYLFPILHSDEGSPAYLYIRSETNAAHKALSEDRQHDCKPHATCEDT